MSNAEQTMFNNEDGANQPEQTNQAAPDNVNPALFDTLVGEGKKFTDKEALAKGKLESDEYITNLENQVKEQKEELGKRATAQEIAEQLRNVSPPETTKPEENTTQGVSAEQVAEIVHTTMTDLEASRSERENVIAAQDAFRKVHGEKTDEVLRAKASELGMSTEELGRIAGKSPTAFAKMVGLDKVEASSGDQSPMSGDQNLEALNIHQNNTSVKEGSQAYWSAKRKELGAAFWTPKIQQQVMADKVAGRYDA